MTPFEIVRLPDAAAVAEEAARRWAALAPRTVALTGGSTPRALYERLARDPWRSRVDWAATELWFGDERAVPPEAADSNYGMARAALLAHVPSLAHRLEGEAEDLDAAARRYEAALPPAFDLMLLGLGPDGHTHSLFPGFAATREETRRVVAVPAPTHVKPHLARLTVTPPVVRAARHGLALVVGAEKAEPLRRVVEAAFDPSATPAQWWRELGGPVAILCDVEAAALLRA